MNRKLVDSIFLAFVFLIPLMPRPTAEGPERFVVPALMMGLLTAWFLIWPKRSTGRDRMPTARLTSLAWLLVLTLAAYLVRVALYESTDEAMVLISRILFALGVFVVTHWLATTKVETKKVARYFLYGFVATSLITIFVGVTKIPILEAESVKPARYLGVVCKTTGIFRSFGEFAIMGSIAWGYLLIFRRDFRPVGWMLMSAIVLAGLLIAQSRNVYLVAMVTTGFIFALTHLRLPAGIRLALPVAILVAPLAIDIALPALKATPGLRQLVGDGDIFEENVRFRYEQFPLAVSLIKQKPLETLLGLPRNDWQEHSMDYRDESVTPHNHFLSNVIFLGVGGVIWVFGLYLVPTMRIGMMNQTGDPMRTMVYVSMLGTIAGLSFYEGFFSLVVMLVISMTWKQAFASTVSTYQSLNPLTIDESDSLPVSSASTISSRAVQCL